MLFDHIVLTRACALYCTADILRDWPRKPPNVLKKPKLAILFESVNRKCHCFVNFAHSSAKLLNIDGEKMHSHRK